MRVRFWGTRGSLATPEPTALRYGGNTPCVEVQAADGTLLVLDCGTGAYGLGQALLAGGGPPPRGHLLLTHTHWDHIQGFPFFAPLRVPGSEWDVYAPGGPGQRLRAILAGQMDYDYFPVELGQLAATVRFHDLVEGSFDAGGVRVTTCYLHHPALTLGYRLEVGGAVVVYATDHEPHGPLPAGAADEEAPAGALAGGSLPLHHEDRRHVAFLAGADLVIHDAQYTLEEYQTKVGWGHSAAEHAVDLARAARARRLALFHHDPLREDGAIDRLVERCRRRAGDDLEVFAAAEGPSLDLPERDGMPRQGGLLHPALMEEIEEPEGEPTVLFVGTEPRLARRLGHYMRPEGLGLLTAPPPGAGGGAGGAGRAGALDLARAARPDLFLLDARGDGFGAPAALDLCRELRGVAEPGFSHAPVILLTAQPLDEAGAGAALAAGVTDFLAEPFTPALVRTMVRRWLMRARTAPTPAAEPQPDPPAEGRPAPAPAPAVSQT